MSGTDPTDPTDHPLSDEAHVLLDKGERSTDDFDVCEDCARKASVRP